ncbi:MAG: hypothetical protein AB7D28_07885 [Candidatus Berkiella sp.]
MRHKTSIPLTLPDLITINTICKTLNKGCATNRFQNSIYPANNCFGVLLPSSFDSHSFGVKGSITWGASGLNFQITSHSSDKTKTSWSAHKMSFELNVDEAETIILEFLQCAKEKLTEQLLNPRKFGRGKFPRIEAHRRDTSKIYRKSESNLEKCYEGELFSLEFKNFVQRNSENKIICSGVPKQN